jgi:hypothetical protein
MNTIEPVAEEGKPTDTDVDTFQNPDPIKVEALNAAVNYFLNRQGYEFGTSIVEMAKVFEKYLREQ